MTLPSTHIKKFNFCYAFHSWSPGILKENSTFLWNRTGKKVYCNSAVYARSYNIIRFFSCQNQVPSYIIYYQTTYIIYYQYIIYTTKKKPLEWNKSRHSRAKKTVSFILISEMKPNSWLYAVGNNLAASNVNYEQPCLSKVHSCNQSSAFRCYGRKNSF